MTDAECEQKFVDKALKRIGTHAGVYGLLVVSPSHGRILHKSGFEDNKEITERWADSLLSFVSVAASTVRTLDHTDDITFLRMQWREKHIIVCPDPNREYTVIVVQNQVHQVAPEAVGGDGIEGSGNQINSALVDQMLGETTSAGGAGGGKTVNDLGATAAPS